MSKLAPSVPTRRLAAVWFADIVGFTGLSARDEHSAMALVSLLQTCARRAVGHCDGRLVKFIGDEAMAEFGSTEASVRAALELKIDFQGLSAPRAVPALLRIGVHVGDIVSSEGDIYGDGVNTASRIQREAMPGEILVSEDVWRHLKGRSEFVLEDRGERELRGLDGTRRLYAVELVEASEKRVAPREEAGLPDSWAIAVLPFVDISPRHVARERDRLDDAEALYQEGLDLCRRIGSQPGVASALQDLAAIALASGRVDRSEELHHEALEITGRLNNKRGMAISLAGLGASAVERKDVDRGVRILGAAERLIGSAGTILPPHEQRWWKARFDSAADAIGSETCERFRVEGRSLSLDAVLELASQRGLPESGDPGRAA